MKHIIYILPLIFLIACDNPQQKSATTTADTTKTGAITGDTLQYLIKTNMNKQPAIDTIALGFIFGMTKADVKNHIEDLKKQKKLVLDNGDDKYKYPMSFDSGNSTAVVTPYYHNGKLYKLVLTATPDIDASDKYELLYDDAANIYSTKYADYSEFRIRDLIDSKLYSYHYIKNNLDIYLHLDENDMVIEYIDLPVDQMLQPAKPKPSASGQDQTKKDI